jgi:hypothetical protein
MLVIASILALPLLIYGLRIAMGNTPSKTNAIRVSLLIYLTLILLYCFLLFAARYNYYLRGYRSTSVVFLAATLGGIIYCLTDRRPILYIGVTRVLLNIIAVLFMVGSVILVIELSMTIRSNYFTLTANTESRKPQEVLWLHVIFRSYS